MTRLVKIVSLGLGLAAFTGLALLGFAVWIFIPLLPAGILLVIILTTARRRAAKTGDAGESTQDLRRAA